VNKHLLTTCQAIVLMLALIQPAQAARSGGKEGRGFKQEWNDFGHQINQALTTGDLDLAETLARQRLALAQNSAPKRQGNALRNLGHVVEQRGRYSDAEILLRKAIPLISDSQGADSRQAINALLNLGMLLHLQARHAEAEAVLREALRRQLAAAPQDPDLVVAYNNYGNVLRSLGRIDEALQMFKQALDAPVSVEAARNGRRNPVRLTALRARTLFSIGTAHARQGKYEDAAREVRQARELLSSVIPQETRFTVAYLTLEGKCLQQLGQLEQAEVILRRAVDVARRILGSAHKDTSEAVAALATLLARQEKAGAEELFRLAVDGARRVGALETLARNERSYARYLAQQSRGLEAVEHYQKALESIDQIFARTQGLDEASRESYIAQFGFFYTETLQLLLRLDISVPGKGYGREALAVVSRTQSRILTELMRQGDVSRLSGDPRMTTLKNRQSELKTKLAELRRTSVQAGRDDPIIDDLDNDAAEVQVQQPGTDAVKARQSAVKARVAAESAPLEKELAAAEDALWQEYPRYMELTQPRPVTVEQLQKTLLRPEETLLSYFMLPDRLLIFVVTRDDFRLLQSPVTRNDLSAWIRAARQPAQDVSSSMDGLEKLDPGNLHQLYRTLFEPIRPLIPEGHRVLVIADGPLYTLPLEMLVERWGETERTAFYAARDGQTLRFEEYAVLPYLGQHYSFNYLPSLSALASVRHYRKPAVNFEQNLVSFADPVFERGSYSAATRAGLEVLSRSVRSGGALNIPRLPETADEAKELAQILGGTSKLFLREAAQEHTAKTFDLRRTRYLHFATHGLLGGEFLDVQAALAPSEEAGDKQAQRKEGIQATAPNASASMDISDEDDAPPAANEPRGQPALLLSLSGVQEAEDGLLTMGEVISTMDLNAQLVVLSACNTAGEGSRAAAGEGFAGLTRAFMYAGAQGMLVSHWAVESQSTRDLIAQTFRHLKAGESSPAALGKARQEVKLSSLDAGGRPVSRAHPYFWAPFVYVGD
jgi:CHAT domain-containing protein/Tfp pilus assembly protein PilF